EAAPAGLSRISAAAAALVYGVALALSCARSAKNLPSLARTSVPTAVSAKRFGGFLLILRLKSQTRTVKSNNAVSPGATDLVDFFAPSTLLALTVTRLSFFA